MLFVPSKKRSPVLRLVSGQNTVTPAIFSEGQDRALKTDASSELISVLNT